MLRQTSRLIPLRDASVRTMRADLFSCTGNLRNARSLLVKFKNETNYNEILNDQEKESLNYHIVRHKQEMLDVHDVKLKELRAQFKGTSNQLRDQKEKWPEGTPCLVGSVDDIGKRLDKLEHVDTNSIEFLRGDYLSDYDTMSPRQ